MDSSSYSYLGLVPSLTRSVRAEEPAPVLALALTFNGNSLIWISVFLVVYAGAELDYSERDVLSGGPGVSAVWYC